MNALDDLGRHLDQRSRLALASTTKASYLGMRSAWENEVEELVDLLAPTRTVGELAQHLARLVTDQSIAGPAPQDSQATGLMPKVIAMHHAGVPAKAITEAIGRRLRAPLQAAESALGYLQALVYIAVFSPWDWREKAMGIQPSSAAPENTQVRSWREQVPRQHQH